MGARRRSRPAIELRGARVLVTGAGSGIGRATALAFAAHGAEVHVVDLDADAAIATAADVQALGAVARSHECDVSSRGAVLALADDVHATGGPLDVLVNNAGVGMSGRFLDTGLDDWDWILGINLLGVVHGCHAFGGAMVEAGSGHVVNVASALGYTPRATEPAYVTTKAAVLALSRCLRADWGPSGVGVTAICPGVIATPIIGASRFVGGRAGAAEDAAAFFAKRGHPPEKVAAAIVDGVLRDRPVVPVGPEAWIGLAAHRLLPSRANDIVARQSLDGI